MYTHKFIEHVRQQILCRKNTALIQKRMKGCVWNEDVSDYSDSFVDDEVTSILEKKEGRESFMDIPKDFNKVQPIDQRSLTPDLYRKSL